MRPSTKNVPPGVAHTNDFPGRYFKTDLEVLPGVLKLTHLKNCSNIRDARAFKIVQANTLIL